MRDTQITVDQFKTHVVDFILLWWGGSSRIWSDPSHVGRLYGEFAPYPLRDIQTALEHIRADGSQHAPTPAKVIERTAAAMISRTGGAVDEHVNWAQVCRQLQTHNWGIVEESADVKPGELPPEELRAEPVGSRLALCARCGVQAVYHPGRLRTASEMTASPEKAM